jgi:hypothetical protein
MGSYASRGRDELINLLPSNGLGPAATTPARGARGARTRARTRAQRSTQANARAAQHADLRHLRKEFYGFICVLRGRDELINLLPSNGLGPAANESRMRPLWLMM